LATEAGKKGWKNGKRYIREWFGWRAAVHGWGVVC